MIEKWLQITCDNDACGETDNSELPNMTIEQFLKDIKPRFVKIGKRHLCSHCAEAEREGRHAEADQRD